MESINVIEIIKNARNQFEYDEHSYFTEVKVINGKTNILSTSDIWGATKFHNMENNEQDAWCRFIKSYYGKHYTINIKPIKLIY